jgi:class 3 adenylate cyclase
MFISLTRRLSIANWEMLQKLNAWALKPYYDAGYVIRRKATILYYFCVSLVLLMPLFLVIYAIWIPHRLPIAGPPMLASMAIGLTCLFILSRGRFYIAGQTLAFVAFLIIALAQYRKLEGEYFTAYSTFIHLFAIPILVVGLFGRKRYILPMYALMVIANVLFFALLRPKIDGEYLTAAQVGLMTSVIALTLITTLLFLLRNVMDSAVTEVEKTNASLNRFVPTEFLQLLNRKNIHEVGLGDHTEQEMTILFADIRNFTGISETLSPAENFSFINDYLSVMGPIIRENNGFIDKYIGDAILALFFNSADAARAAVAMHEMLQRFNAQFIDGIFPEIRIGIGIHTGRIMLGTIGEVRRMENTVISDTVNAASRIESLTKKLGAAILLSGESLAQVPKDDYRIRLVDVAQLRGKTQTLKIYELLNPLPEERQHQLLANAEDFEKGIEAMRAGRFDEAVTLFEKCLAKVPADGAAQHHLRLIEKTRLLKSRKAT